MIEKAGQYFIRLDILSFEQAEEILIIQQSSPEKKFGEIAMELGYISLEDLDDFLKK
ncbi:MAG: hypothetical protein JEZ04_12960 [Spirochaetales bacterium]|nr:hypothetical protein [Spirochaetales bacterium]